MRSALAACALALIGCALVACQRTDPDAPTQLDEYYLGKRRKDVPFGAHRDPLPEDALTPARRMDAIEGMIDEERYDEASQALDRWIAEGGDHPRAHYLRGRIAYGQHRWEDAVTSLTRAIEAAPRYIEARLLLAQAYLKLERLAAAESVYQDLDRLGPKLPWGPLGMAIVAARRGDAERATRLCDTALGRDEKNAPSLRLRAQLARQAGDAEREEPLLLRLVAVEPADADAEARLGELAEAAKRDDDARRHFERSYELVRDPSVARRLADLAQARGDAESADRWRKRAGIHPADKPAAPGGDEPFRPK